MLSGVGREGRRLNSEAASSTKEGGVMALIARRCGKFAVAGWEELASYVYVMQRDERLGFVGYR